MTAFASPVSIFFALLSTLPVSALLSDSHCPDPGLEISVTVNGRPAAPDPLIRTGGQVRISYRLTDTGDRDIEDVRLAAGLGETISCPAGGAEVPKLEEHSSVECVAVLDAAAGPHDGTVTATGHTGHDDDDDHRPVTASAPVGYRGVGGLITATDSVSVTMST